MIVIPSAKIGAEELRAFLNGEGEFPQNIAIRMLLIDPFTDPKPPLIWAACPPYSLRDGRYHTHRFLLCGLVFEVHVGNQLACSARQLCFHRNRPPVVCIAPEAHFGLCKALRNFVAGSEWKGD